MDETATTLPFADGDYKFFLPLPRVVAAEREADCSIFQLFYDIGENVATLGEEMVLNGASPATIKQCQALIRNALIGGGQTEEQARDLVSTYCYPARPAIRDIALTWSILDAAIYGIKVKKKVEPAPTAKPRRSQKGT